MGPLLTALLFVVFLVGSCTSESDTDFMLLTLEAIAQQQDKTFQKLDEQEKKANVQQTMMQDLQTKINMIEGSLKSAEENIRHQFEEYEKCASKDEVDAFQDLIQTDECSTGSHKCSENATCKNTCGHYVCSCLPGYFGDGFICEEIDECQQTPSVCGDEQICTKVPGNYTCTCHDGYKKERYTCQDIDECELDDHRCAQYATCNNTIGSYNCKCFPKYEGDGYTCNEIDECQQTPSVCGDEQICTKFPGNYTCTCHDGYKKEGYTCQDINECESDDHSCAQYATCNNTIGSYNCKCFPNFQGNGYTCDGINECALGEHTCDPFAECTNTIWNYTCECLPFSDGDGYSCNFSSCSSPAHEIPGLGCVIPMPERMSWDEAQRMCKRKGTRLVEGITWKHLEMLEQQFATYFFDYWFNIGFRGGLWVTSRDPIVDPEGKLFVSPEPDGSEELQNDCGLAYLEPLELKLLDDDCSLTALSLCQIL